MIRRWYQRSRICVAASCHEGFGFTPLEAMATGCVLVRFGVGVWPWITQPDFGLVFQTGSATSLANQLAPLMTDMQKIRSSGAGRSNGVVPALCDSARSKSVESNVCPAR